MGEWAPDAVLPSSIEARLFINGKFVPSSNNETFDVYSPSTGNLVARVYEASKEDVDSAVAAAKMAFPSWSALSPSERGKYLARLASLIEESRDELAVLEAMSMGKPLSRFIDGQAAVERFRYFSEAAYPQGSTSLHTPGYVNLLLRQPVGVAAAILPWNFPLLFFAEKAAAALAAGCTVVLKSSEKAPLTSLKVASLVEKAGFPRGVFNIISGNGPVCGNALASHMDVRVISFTGSLHTGRAIQKAAADSNMKNVVLELGGKSPVLVFEDADLQKAVTQTHISIMSMSGQTCMANSRIYVQKSIADQFITKFRETTDSNKIGDPLDKDTFQGPQVDKFQVDTVLKYIESGKETGKLLIGGGKSEAGDLFINPTIFLDQPENARVMKEEIFGPVVTINTFESEADVIQKANDTDFGLYAAIFTKDLDRAMRVCKALEAGTVGINCTSPVTATDMPFGGYKSSGIGREDLIRSMDHYLEMKTVLIKVDDL